MAAMSATPGPFPDRQSAGRELGATLARLGLKAPVVYALPRGGVPVACEVAKAIGAPLDLLLVRKIGAPGAPELALGAAVDGARPQTLVNESVISSLRVGEAYLRRARDEALAEIERRRRLYMKNRAPIGAGGRTAVVVDDGLATGATMRIAVRALRPQSPARIVVAVPVAPQDAVDALLDEVEQVVSLRIPDRFPGVGAFYADFHQLSDEEVIALLDQADKDPGALRP